MNTLIKKHWILIACIMLLIIWTLIFWWPTETRKIESNDLSRNSIIEISNKEIIEFWNEKIINENLIADLNNKNKAIENNISRLQVCKSLNEAVMWTVGESIDCDTIPAMKLKTPDELFYTYKVSDNPYISQPEQDHFHKWRWWVLATDIASWFQAEQYAPDYVSEVKAYKVEVFNWENADELLWNYAKLNFTHKWHKYYWIIAHLDTRMKTGDTIYTGQKIGQTDLSGYTTGYHAHVELWFEGVNISYSTRSSVLTNSRAGVYENDGIWAELYFTHYDLWDVAQNDSTPCIWASGKDLCEISKQWIQTIALTVDQRKLYNIEFGDIITVKSIAQNTEYTVQVEDEMNKRFRNECNRKLWACIKWDIAHYNWVSLNWMESWIYTIIK